MGKVKIDLTRQFFRARQFLPGGLLINGMEICGACRVETGMRLRGHCRELQ
jgi:hypothetical protein